MTDEERHADEVNIAFQMGAEWQKKQSDSAWKGIHEGAVLAMQGRINELEDALKEILSLGSWGANDLARTVAREALKGKEGA